MNQQYVTEPEVSVEEHRAAASELAPPAAVRHRPPAQEVRVLLPQPLATKMTVYMTLLGQSSQAFVQAAIMRHLEALGVLLLDLSPPSGKGVRIVVGGPDAPLRRLGQPVDGDE